MRELIVIISQKLIMQLCIVAKYFCDLISIQIPNHAQAFLRALQHYDSNNILKLS